MKSISEVLYEFVLEFRISESVYGEIKYPKISEVRISGYPIFNTLIIGVSHNVF